MGETSNKKVALEDVFKVLVDFRNEVRDEQTKTSERIGSLEDQFTKMQADLRKERKDREKFESDMRKEREKQLTYARMSSR